MNDKFFEKYPHLECCRDSMFHAEQELVRCFREGNKLLLVGNGGSCADALHICSELGKSFKRKRELSQEQKDGLLDLPFGRFLGQHLEGSLGAITIGSNPSLMTALVNDKVDARIIFAQEILGLGFENDTLWGISTSGEAENVIMATSVAKFKGMRIIGLTGPNGGSLAEVSDISIRAPGEETAEIQENHIKIYHSLCESIEILLFPNG